APRRSRHTHQSGLDAWPKVGRVYLGALRSPSSDMSPQQVRTIALCAIVVVLDGFDTQCMGFLVPVISENLHIALPSFGPVLSAALVGLMVAAMASGPIADRWGRRWVVIVSVLVFALFALLTARAQSLQELVLYRFLTGLGLGGAMPNAVALTSEFTPKRLQALGAGGIFPGRPAGAGNARQAGACLLSRWRWCGVGRGRRGGGRAGGRGERRAVGIGGMDRIARARTPHGAADRAGARPLHRRPRRRDAAPVDSVLHEPLDPVLRPQLAALAAAAIRTVDCGRRPGGRRLQPRRHARDADAGAYHARHWNAHRARRRVRPVHAADSV